MAIHFPTWLLLLMAVWSALALLTIGILARAHRCAPTEEEVFGMATDSQPDAPAAPCGHVTGASIPLAPEAG